MTFLEQLDTLRRAMTGRLVLPDDAAYDGARQGWSRIVDQRPAAVAEPADVDDLRHILRTAREAGLRVLVQPVGHGACDALEDVILVRMSAFDHIEVDHASGTATVGAGVRFHALFAALDVVADRTLLAPAGTSGSVSVVGLLLNGGHGWLSRRTGLSAQHLRRVELLRPDGATAGSTMRRIPS